MAQSKQPPVIWLLAAGVVQGLMFYWLYCSLDAKVWPATDPMWFTPLFTLTVFTPLLFQLSVSPVNVRTMVLPISVATLLITMCASYVGYMIYEFGYRSGSITFWFACSIVIAAFKAAMYIQQRANDEALRYPLLFTYSWRNFLTTALGIAFVGAVALILFLWSALFRVIGIGFFDELFWEPWFLIPVLSVAFGGAVSIFRKLEHVIDNITHLLEGLIRILLPLVSVLAIVFLVTLPVVGLAPLWGTGNGTALLLCLLALMLFFTNAVYQGGDRQDVYPALIRWLICVGLLTLPFYAALSFYGLWLRVDEYGWTVERGWALLVWLVLTIFAIGYAIGVIRKQLDWPVILAKTNIYMGWGVLALMLAANSPILDLRKISLSSQIDRSVESGKNWRDFDFHYARRHLGRPAVEFVERLKADNTSDEELLALIEAPQVTTQIDFDAELTYHGERFDVPEQVKQAFSERAYYSKGQQMVALRVDLNRDGAPDIVLLTHDNRFIHYTLVATYTDSDWQIYDMFPLDQSPENDIADVLSQPVSAETPDFDDLKFGDLTLRVSPR